jgi:hypothetical protein
MEVLVVAVEDGASGNVATTGTVSEATVCSGTACPGELHAAAITASVNETT